MMSGSRENSVEAAARIASPVTYVRPVVEWLIWVGLAALVYSQTSRFDQEIAEYALGASGWPRSLCLAVIVGATGQFVYQMTTIWRGKDLIKEESDDSGREKLGTWRLVQRLGIFFVPLIYLYVMPAVGFYVATPIFIVILLLLLEVRSLPAIATVTVIVYGLALLIFTRLFYVALPTGHIEAFYDINNAIISIVRAGM